MFIFLNHDFEVKRFPDLEFRDDLLFLLQILPKYARCAAANFSLQFPTANCPLINCLLATAPHPASPTIPHHYLTTGSHTRN
jgi:hypothetical protein